MKMPLFVSFNSSRQMFVATAVAALAALALGLLDAPQAKAQVAARVESQTRPNFGLLLEPPVRSRPRTQHRRWNYHRDRGLERPVSVPPPLLQEEIVLVDCGGNSGTGAVEAAIRRVRAGGTLVLRARGGPCVGWLDIDKPMTIIGEAGFDPHNWDRYPTPTLQAPDGMPCMTVSPNIRVYVRDVLFASPNAGRAPCVEGAGGEVVMNRVGFRHTGDEAAIIVDGGLLDIRDARIEADTISAAIVATGATLTTDEVYISGALSGIEVEPGAGETSRISRTTLMGPNAQEDPGALNNYGPRAIGLLARSGRQIGRIDVVNSKICGYVEGVVAEGTRLNVNSSLLCRVEKGVVVYNGDLSLDASRVHASRAHVLVEAGEAAISSSDFAGLADIAYGDVTLTGNRHWSVEGRCAPRFLPRYKDRYTPYWEPQAADGTSPFTCMKRAYPRSWWEDDQGDGGRGYHPDIFLPEQFSRFQQGRGWYDCSRDHRYVDDARYVGDDRWRKGGWSNNRDCERSRPDSRVSALIYIDFNPDIDININRLFGFSLFGR